MNTIRIQKKQTQLIAHRGLSGLEAENTLCAFVAAGNRSYFGIETDVHRTSDGQFIIVHDNDTARVAGNAQVYEVERTDYATLRSLPLLDRQDGWTCICRALTNTSSAVGTTERSACWS